MNGIEPFHHATTIANLTSLLFRACFLEENTLGLCPEYGYTIPNARRQSLIATQYLGWYEKIHNCHLTKEYPVSPICHADAPWPEKNKIIMLSQPVPTPPILQTCTFWKRVRSLPEGN